MSSGKDANWGSEMWAAPRERIPWGCLSVSACPICYQSCPPPLRLRVDVCCANCCRPELLQRSSFALGLGSDLSGTLQSAASKATVVFSRCRVSKPAVESDGHILFILKGTGRARERLLLAALNVCALKLRSLANEICCICWHGK